MTRASDTARLLGAGATINDGTTISTADNDAQLILKCTDTDAGTGPKLELNRNPGEAGADGDNLGQIEFYGYNDASQKSQYAYLFAEAADVADGSEDVKFGLGGLVAGADTNLMTFTHGTSATGADPEMVFNDSSKDINFRVESDNDTHAFFLNGASGKIGLGTNSTDADLHIEPKTGNTDASLLLSNSGRTQYFRIQNNETSDLLRINANDTTNVMDIDSTGAITMPLQPAFLVQPSTPQSDLAATGNNVAIAFGTERFDQNSDFASNTFTAPTTGKYQLNANIYLTNIDSAADYYQLTLFTSNRNYFYAFDVSSADADPNRFTFQVSTLADMDASDQASVMILQVNGTAQTDIAVESYFSGYLVA